MKINILDSFANDLNSQVDFIAKDKPLAARRFKSEVLKLIKKLHDMPYQNRKSVYFDDIQVREKIYKGYKILYRIKPEENVIDVFGFMNFQEGL